MISVNVRGLREFEEQVKELGEALAVKALASAARKAFKPVVEDAKAHVAADTAALRDAIKLRTKKPKEGAAVVAVGLAIAGPSRKSKRMAKVQRRLVKRGLASADSTPGVNPRSRWHFEEFGTSKKQARPYIRPAFDKNVDGMVRTLNEEIGKAIQRAVRRKRKKAGLR